MTDDNGRPSRLGPRARRWLLVAHLLSVAAWFGADVVIAVLVATAVFGSDPVTAGASVRALGVFAVWILSVAGLATLASGLILAVGSGRGVLRYWWIAVKLGINVVLTALVPIGLAPAIDAAQDNARDLMAGVTTQVELGNLVYPPVVAPALLVAAVLIAVFKPWGLLRRRRR